MSRKANNLRKRLAIIQQQDRERREMEAKLEHFKKECTADLAKLLGAKRMAEEAQRQLERFTALSIRVEHHIPGHDPDMKMLNVCFHPRDFGNTFRRGPYNRMGVGQVSDIGHYASMIGREAGDKIAAAIVEHVTGKEPERPW